MPIRFKQYKNKELARQRRNEQRKKYYGKTAYASKHKMEWTKVEDEYVLAHTMTDFELAQMLKRSVKAIQLRRCRLKKGKPMTDKQIIIDNLNSGVKCNPNCPLHKLFTHNACIQCKALKDSPYHKDYLKNKTDDEIAEEIIELEKEFED